MKTITDSQEINTILEQYNGGNAQVWFFEASRKRLALRLSLPNQSIDEVAYVVVISCKSMSGPFSWKNARVTIITDSDSSESFVRVVDNEAGFQLVSLGGAVLVHGPEREIEIS